MAKGKHSRKKRRPQWCKLMVLLVVLFGFVITQECFVLMYLCVVRNYLAAAAWLTAAIGVGEAVIALALNGYLSLCKIDHSDGGITMEKAKAKNFVEDWESPSI